MITGKEPTLGEIIKKSLIDSNLNQSAVAKKMGVSKQVINQIDRRKNFDLEFLTKLYEITSLDFTKYLTKNGTNEILDTSKVNEINTNTIEMSLTIRVKGSVEEVNNMGLFMAALRNEAAKMGLAII